LSPSRKRSSEQHHAIEFERAVQDLNAERVHVQLYVAGMGPRSTQAVADLKRLRARYRCRAEIIDIYRRPQAAVQAQILAVPTLVRELPAPRRCIVGTIRNIDHVAGLLGLSAYRTRVDEQPTHAK
jgi:circadian clock protein KaiB